jgi:hypothetical protein
MTPRVISPLLITLIAMPALADEMTPNNGRFFITLIPVTAEMPPRKAGLWEYQTDGSSAVYRQCTDANTEQMRHAPAGTAVELGDGAAPHCSKPEVQKSGDTLTIDSTCTVAGRTVTSHKVVSGSFDSAYAMTETNQTVGVLGGTFTITMTAKWLGPCAADQKPGDVILPNGTKINILDIQKRALPGAPPPLH